MIAAKTYDKNLQFKRTTAEEFKSWVDQINAGKQARGENRLVGVLSFELIKQLESLNNPSLIPHNSAILLRDKQLLHLFRDSKKRRDATLSYNSIQQLPKLINEPLAIYYDELDPALVYVISSVEVSSEKVIVRINYSETIREDNIRQDVRSNFIRSAGRVDNTDLKDKRHRLLWDKK